MPYGSKDAVKNGNKIDGKKFREMVEAFLDTVIQENTRPPFFITINLTKFPPENLVSSAAWKKQCEYLEKKVRETFLDVATSSKFKHKLEQHRINKHSIQIIFSPTIDEIFTKKTSSIPASSQTETTPDPQVSSSSPEQAMHAVFRDIKAKRREYPESSSSVGSYSASQPGFSRAALSPENYSSVKTSASTPHLFLEPVKTESSKEYERKKNAGLWNKFKQKLSGTNDNVVKQRSIRPQV